MYLEESIKLINDKLAVLKGKQNIAVWGAGENTVRLFQLTDIVQYNINIIIDNGKYGEVFWGKTVLAASDINWNNIEAVIISAFYRENEIFDELKNKYFFDKTIVRLNDINQEKPFYQHLLKSEVMVPLEYRDIISSNQKFHNIHQGEKVFIIGNGPSIKNTDLKKIKNARKMVVSNFYLHEDYNIVKPDYHCFAQFTYTDKFNEDVARKWLSDIGKHSGTPHFFFNISEKRLVDECSSLKEKDINYMYLDALNLDYYDEIDITNKMMCGQSVTIDCIQLAIYMGFKEIYLVGIEHSEIVTGQYDYFYDRDLSKVGDRDTYTSNSGKVVSRFSTQLYTRNCLWKQYERLNEIIDKKGIEIYNATKGGILDIFKRIDYDLL